MNAANVKKPGGPLNPASVQEVFSEPVAAIDCSAWIPVYHEGVREILRQVRRQQSQTILYRMPPDLALQVSLCGMGVQDDTCVIPPDCLSRGIGQCPFCGVSMRYESEGRHRCPACGQTVYVEDGSISA